MARPPLLPPAEVRRRILDAADRLLAGAGYARMTIAALAAEAGIGKGSVYLHFPSKREVALACIDRNAGLVVARLEALAAGRGPVPSRLRAMLLARILLRFDYARPHSASLDLLLADFRQELLARRAGHFAREAQVLARVLAEGRREGRVARRPLRPVADALVAGTNALLPFSLGARELGRRPALARRAGAVVDLLLHGVLVA